MPPPERHSTARRAQLKKSIPDIIVSQQYSIKKYYSLSESLLEMFMDSFEKSALNDAYIYGLRFIMIVTDVVPKHGYYNSSEFNSEKSRSRRMANTVLDQMEQIVDQMDIEEAERTLVLNARLLSEKKETARLVLQNEMREAKRREEMSAAEKYLPKEVRSERTYTRANVRASERMHRVHTVCVPPFVAYCVVAYCAACAASEVDASMYAPTPAAFERVLWREAREALFTPPSPFVRGVFVPPLWLTLLWQAPPAPVFEPSTTPAPVFTPSAPPPAFDDEGLFDEEKALPPPLPPPSYDVTVASATGAVSHASVSPPPPPPSASISPLFLTTATTVASTTLYPSLKRRTPTIPMHQMKSVYLSDWSDLLASKRASVYVGASEASMTHLPHACVSKEGGTGARKGAALSAHTLCERRRRSERRAQSALFAIESRLRARSKALKQL